ncbi:MAG TPA: protease SohB [Gammaproteobacteria bacterium]|jgi:serine protease SohB
MEFLIDYGLFLAKSVTVVVAILLVFVVIMSLRMREKHKTGDGHIEVKHLNDRLRDMQQCMKLAVLDKFDLKRQLKADKAKAKAEAKARKRALKEKQVEKSGEEPGADDRKKAVYVLDFHGDIRAQAVGSLREEITAVISSLVPGDEVVVRLESSGGLVHAYGLAASQLKRIKDKGVKLTVCVDKVAASGGYMMACIADRILAAPFALLGSIGVVAQLPNFHRLLRKHDIDYEMLTAGEYKRTLTILGENTEKSRAKFQEDLEDIHTLFKEFVCEHRPAVDIDQVATGEVWFGKRALERRLVDALQTSDAFLVDLCETAEVYEVKYVEKKSLQERMSLSLNTLADGLLLKWFERLSLRRFFQ